MRETLCYSVWLRYPPLNPAAAFAEEHKYQADPGNTAWLPVEYHCDQRHGVSKALQGGEVAHEAGRLFRFFAQFRIFTHFLNNTACIGKDFV